MHLSTATSLIHSKKIQSNNITAWADLGCGDGLFSHALSSLLSAGSSITAVDKNARAFKHVVVTNGICLQTVKANFEKDDLPLNKLDGVLMANALHFVKHKKSFIAKLQTMVMDHAQILLVEYNTSRSNIWVPYPCTVDGYEQLFKEAGYNYFEVINSTPSKFGRSDITGMLIEK